MSSDIDRTNGACDNVATCLRGPPSRWNHVLAVSPARYIPEVAGIGCGIDVDSAWR